MTLHSVAHHAAPRKRASIPSVGSALLLLIVAAGVVLRLHLLTRRDLWVDEALSVVLARMPWRHFWQALWDFQANMALYYLLLRGWLHLGDSEGLVRSSTGYCSHCTPTNSSHGQLSIGSNAPRRG